MSPIRLLSMLPLALVACTGDQSYTPIGEDQADELCEPSVLTLNEVESVTLEPGASGQASHSGLIEVTYFSRTEMRVDTDEVIVSVPANSIARVSVAEGSWDFFSDMVFAVDIREPGALAWQEIALESAAYDFFWFKEIELNPAAQSAALSTLSLCSTVAIDGENVEVSISGAYELRIRAFPFAGQGDLVGQYDYTIDVSITE